MPDPANKKHILEKIYTGIIGVLVVIWLVHSFVLPAYGWLTKKPKPPVAITPFNMQIDKAKEVSVKVDVSEIYASGDLGNPYLLTADLSVEPNTIDGGDGKYFQANDVSVLRIYFPKAGNIHFKDCAFTGNDAQCRDVGGNRFWSIAYHE